MIERDDSGKALPGSPIEYTPEIGSRIKSIIDSVGGLTSAGALAGVTDETVAKWRDGKVKAPAFGLATIAAAAGRSVDWVLFGGDLASAEPSSQAIRFIEDDVREAFAFIPKFQISASAGGGAIAVHEEVDGVLAFRQDWLRRHGINPEAAAVLTARGDSMEPTIRDGDTLLVDKSIDRVRDNGIYVVVIGGLVVVKRLHVSRDGSITLLSENSIYPPEHVPAGEVSELIFAGRVMWFGRPI